MTNPIKGETVLALKDGRTYTLVLDHEALIKAEAGYGKPLDQLMDDAAKGFVGAARALLYGALQAKHSGATLGAATEMWFADQEAVMAAITAAAVAALPLVKELTPEGNGEAGPAGTSSSANGAKPVSTPKRSGKRPRASSKSSSALA